MGKNIVLKIINGLSCIAITVAVFILLIVVMTKEGDVPNVMGYSAFRVLTGSMEPTIQTDSFILVKRVDPSEIKKGDIISFFFRDSGYGNAVNTHRVVSVETDGNKWIYVTKGDANYAQDDDPVSSDDLIGKVVFSSHSAGVIIRLLVNPLIFVPLILLPLIGLLVYNLVKTIQITRNIAKEEEAEAIREAMMLIKKEKEDKG